MRKSLRRVYDSILSYNEESKSLLSFLSSVGQSSELEILDVGCGYGRMLSLLKANHYKAEGVEVNHAILQVTRGLGHVVMTPDEFKTTAKQYDVIIMFHIIEHFSPDPLLEFMDFYLDRLKPSGYLIIATPIMTKYFYQDFDHIKPYDPLGIEMVFGGANAQVQYFSRNKLKLVDLKYKRYFHRFTNIKSLYLKTPERPVVLMLGALSAILFKVSGGFIGKKDGWMGLYQKVSGN